MPLEELSGLCIGRRDALLLQLREQTFGSTLRCCTECPRCGSRLEIAVDSAALKVGASVALDAAQVHKLTVGDLTITFRVPCSRDLLGLTECGSAQEAERRLLGRCVQSVAQHSQGGGAESVAEIALPAAALQALGAALLRLDPQAVLNLAMRCAGCGHGWKSVLDIGSFFFTEVKAQAERLAREIGVLARAFGWSERAILAMSPRRRQLYLQEAES
jgi:hypothetical protein